MKYHQSKSIQSNMRSKDKKKKNDISIIIKINTYENEILNKNRRI